MSDVKIIVSSENWEVRRDDGEELVVVEIAPRVCMKMRKSEAIAKGLYTSPPAPLPGGEGGGGTAKKRRKEGRNKMRLPAGDKAGEGTSDG